MRGLCRTARAVGYRKSARAKTVARRRAHLPRACSVIVLPEVVDRILLPACLFVFHSFCAATPAPSRPANLMP